MDKKYLEMTEAEIRKEFDFTIEKERLFKRLNSVMNELNRCPYEPLEDYEYEMLKENGYLKRTKKLKFTDIGTLALLDLKRTAKELELIIFERADILQDIELEKADYFTCK